MESYKKWTIEHRYDPNNNCIVLTVSDGETSMKEMLDPWVTNSIMKEEILWEKAKRIIQRLENELRKEMSAAC